MTRTGDAACAAVRRAGTGTAPRGVLVGALLVTALMPGCNRDSLPDGTLRFLRAGTPIQSLSFEEMAKLAPPQTITTEDPYYQKKKRFRAFALEPVARSVFDADLTTLRERTFVLRARDGYAVPVDGARLFEGGAHVAFADVDVPGFEPIGPQKVSPAPAYLVWSGSGQTDPTTYPRPWQLVAIEEVRFETAYPHTFPRGSAEGSPARRGYQLFRDQCIRCHAMNREGGRVGPDLNVPRSIVEYRAEDQIRRYIVDPLSFRYGAMPPHPDLSAQDLDALLAYLHAMSELKHDPDAKKGGGHP